MSDNPRLCGVCRKRPITDDELECGECVAEQEDSLERAREEERDQAAYEAWCDAKIDERRGK